jgi:hypothetical protein
MTSFEAQAEALNEAKRKAVAEDPDGDDVSEAELEATKLAYLMEKRRMLDEISKSSAEHLKLEQESDAHRLELAHIASLESLNQTFEAKRRMSKEALDKRLASMKDKRKGELVSQGLSEVEADAQVDSEAKALVDAEMQALVNEEKTAKERVQSKFSKLMDNLRSQYQKSVDILHNGVDAHIEKSTADIMSKLQAEKEQYITSQIENGVTSEEATAKADAEFSVRMEAQQRENDTLIKLASDKLNDLLSDNLEVKARNIRAEHEKKIVGLAAAQAKERDDATRALRNRLEKRKAKRVDALEALGIDRSEAEAIAAVEFSDIDHQVEAYDAHFVDKQSDDFNSKADALAK